MRRVLSFGLLALAVVVFVWLSRPASLGSGAPVDSAAIGGTPDGEAEVASPDPSAPDPAAEASIEGLEREPLEPASEPPPAAGFAGRLIDADTSEPVPWYELELRAEDGEAVRVTSDREGRFTTSGALALGPIRMALLDIDGQPSPSESRRGSVTVERGDGPPSEVRIDVGPTYFVDVVLPDPLVPADLRARLFQDPPELRAERVDAETCETVLRAPCGGSTLAWARFRLTNERHHPQWLELSSVDGLWVGGARVPSGPGVHRDPVQVTLGSACAVRGRYVSTAGPPARGRGALAMFREGAEFEPRWAFADGEGRFRLSGLEPGAYRLEVRDEALRAEPVRFALGSGERDLGDLPWTPIPLAGSVRLRVRSEVEIPIDVQLVRRFDPPHDPPWHSDEWEPFPGGGFESRFEWDEVYAGALEIVVHSHDLGDWHLSLGELEPPVEDLSIRLPAPRPALVLSVVDDATGAALDSWTVLVRGERGWEELDESPKTLRFAVWDEDTAFAVCSPGYRAWLATPGTHGFPGTAGGPLIARLQRGWSHLFLARKRSRGSALEGVEIRLDGRSAGRTDARGELWVHAGAPATELEVTHPTLIWTDEAWEPRVDFVTWVELHT